MKYNVGISGLTFNAFTRFKNLEVKVYEEDINFRTLKRKDAGFTVEDIPMNDFSKWLLVGSDRWKEEIDMPIQNSGIKYTVNDFRIYFNVSKNMTSKIVSSDLYWLEQELLEIKYDGVNTIDGVDYDTYIATRGYGTVNQFYASPYFLEFMSYDENTSKYRYSLSNYIDNFEGLPVTLYNPETNIPMHRGVIKKISVVNYGVTIECIPISEGLDFAIPDLGIKYLMVASNNLDVSFWGLMRHTLLGEDIYDGFSPFMNHRPAISIMATGNLDNVRPIIPDFIRNQDLVNNNSVTAGDDGNWQFNEEAPKINVLKLVYVIEVLTGYFLFTKHSIEFKNIYGKVTDFTKNVLDHINLKERVNIDKFVVTPFTTLGSIDVSWKEGKTYFSSSTVVSAVGSDKIALDLSWLERTDEREQELLDGFVDRHLYLNDTKISVIKLQVPFLDDTFQLGSTFVIDDIDEYFTFQDVENNRFTNEGTVISKEDKGSGIGEIEIVLGNISIIKPLAPFICGKVVSLDEPNNFMEVEFLNLEDKLLFKDLHIVGYTYGFNDASPFVDENNRDKWFKDGDLIQIFRKDVYETARVSRGLVDGVVNNYTLSLEYNGGAGTFNINDNVCISYRKDSDWGNHFLLIGVDKWQD